MFTGFEVDNNVKIFLFTLQQDNTLIYKTKISMNQKNLKRILCLALGMVMSLGFAFAQGGKAKAISGVVKDASGEPLIGVSVQVKGTQTGVVTNIDGEFSIAKAEEGKTLVLSYVGYNNKEVRISSQNKYSITMEENTKGLEEVVVIGYGTQKRKDLTGSVVSVGSEALSVVPVSTAAEALQGKMAGVQITTTEGSPDAEMKIRVLAAALSHRATSRCISSTASR